MGAFAVLRRNGNRFGDGADALEYLSEARRGGLAVSNAYERASGRAIGDGFYGYELLAAAGAATRLAYAEGGAPAPATFAISPPALALGGDEFAFPAVGDYDVAATSASGVSAVTAKIVRRELRRLSDAERDAYLDAIRVLYATPDADGLRLYGARLQERRLLRAHAPEGAPRTGPATTGTTTRAYSTTTRASPGSSRRRCGASTRLRPRTTGTTPSDAADLGDAWPESFVFGDDWFGAPESDTHVVSRGRFAFGATPRYANASVALLHGPVHIMVGGHWGVDDAWAAYLSTQKSNDYWLLLSKYLWRQGYAECPTGVFDDAPEARWQACACPALDAGDLDAATILVDSDVADLAPPQGQWLEKLRREANFTEDDALRLLCAVGTPGELFTSAAPQDPLFWPLHGNAERFLSYARALAAAGELDLDEAGLRARSGRRRRRARSAPGRGRPAGLRAGRLPGPRPRRRPAF
ncbi:regulator of chromosome condensation [Aureococcus anophagefferens]|uniref:Regulator of chromosome condensation n=1 Tax=Aureococcus anophagefferens TaxID=44056 RepID=A0ABR1GA51_AURAN